MLTAHVYVVDEPKTMFIHATSLLTHFHRKKIIKETKECLKDLHCVILMNFMKLVCYTLQVFSLTSLYIVFSHQQNSYIKLKNVFQNRPAYKLMSGACCGKKNTNCDMKCKIKFNICLFKISDNSMKCLIKAEVNNPMASSTIIVNLNKTIGVRIFYLFLTFIVLSLIHI